MANNHFEKCLNCFCRDLCFFLLSKVGVVTTCDDLRSRVQAIVDTETDKAITSERQTIIDIMDSADDGYQSSVLVAQYLIDKAVKEK